MDHAVTQLSTDQIVCELVSQVVLFGVLVIAAYTDLVHGRVYNWLTYPAILLGLILGFGVDGIEGVADRFGGLALGAGIFALGSLTGGVGAGDMKLMAAIGSLTGWSFVVGSAFYSTLFGAAIAIGIMAYHGRVLLLLKRSFRYALGLDNAPVPENDPILIKVRLGVTVAFGTLLFWAIEQGVLA